MSEATDALRRELTEHRERLAGLQRDDGAFTRTVEDLENQLAQQQRQRELVRQRIAREKHAVEAVEAALSVYAERMPAATDLNEPFHITVPERTEAPAQEPETGPALPANPIGLRVVMNAESLDLGNVSQRSRARAEKLRDILDDANGPMDTIALAAKMAEHEPTAAKAQTAVEVGLTVLIAEGRARCVNSQQEVWELTPPERASANLGSAIANFRGRTSRWPNQSTLPAPGTRITIEEGSYEGGKKR